MKNILLVILTYFIGLQMVAQEKVIMSCDPPPTKSFHKEEVKDENYIYGLVHKKAGPKVGFQNFYEIFLNEFNKEGLYTSKEEVICRIRFVVEKDGSFSDIQIVQDNDGIGEEAVRVLKTTPKWNPAQHEGKIVRSSFTLPIKIPVN